MPFKILVLSLLLLGLANCEEKKSAGRKQEKSTTLNSGTEESGSEKSGSDEREGSSDKNSEEVEPQSYIPSEDPSAMVCCDSSPVVL